MEGGSGIWHPVQPDHRLESERQVPYISVIVLLSSDSEQEGHVWVSRNIIVVKMQLGSPCMGTWFDCNIC